jgi:hypothetical protein
MGAGGHTELPAEIGRLRVEIPLRRLPLHTLKDRLIGGVQDTEGTGRIDLIFGELDLE